MTWRSVRTDLLLTCAKSGAANYIDDGLAAPT